MAKPLTRTCQICHGKAVRDDPGWWSCHDCGYSWRVGVNPIAAMQKQAKARSEATRRAQAASASINRSYSNPDW